MESGYVLLNSLGSAMSFAGRASEGPLCLRTVDQIDLLKTCQTSPTALLRIVTKLQLSKII